MKKIDSLGRRIPKRTKRWGKNISKALRKGKVKPCKCGKIFYTSPYRQDSSKYCSMSCQRKYREYGQKG